MLGTETNLRLLNCLGSLDGVVVGSLDGVLVGISSETMDKPTQYNEMLHWIQKQTY